MLIKLETGEKTKHFLTALYCFFFQKCGHFFRYFVAAFMLRTNSASSVKHWA